jgi:riboflavin synthase
MFTGLVEGCGTLLGRVTEGAGVRLAIEPPPEMQNAIAVGDSVSINGCCLTVVEFDRNAWSFQAGPETLARTNLGRLQVGDRLNLERSLPVEGRLGGHFVQGHVDGLGRVVDIISTGEWVTMWFAVPEPLALQMVSKGSVAVDGISLTLVDVQSDRFSVALIPHTLRMSNLGERRIGDAVNIETDILAKYVQKLLGNTRHERH